MKVHIVHYQSNTTDHILQRLVDLLCNRTGWTSGHTPNGNAELNYFLPYLVHAEKSSGWQDTPTAAYFSHLDPNAQNKSNMWHEAARHMDLCIVTANLYGDMLQKWGRRTAFAHAPIDPQFKPTRPVQETRPIIGVSGFLYNDGRKGEQFVEKMVSSDLGRKLVWKASGRGWKINDLHNYLWNEMPAFYQRLNVYLCAALTEGVPMPPLEAMSCGIRCVIPIGVGMLDQLPDLPDLYRFKAGDYDDMARAVEQAAFDERPVNVTALRAAVVDYNANQWVLDHIEAFEALLRPALPVEVNLPAWKGKAGVVYVAYGKQSRECAVRAIQSFKRFMPGIPVALVSEVPLGPEDIFIPHADTDVGARGVKTRLYDLTPKEWDYVLYLDADTELVADISPIFEWLQKGWELVICKNPARFHTTRNMLRPDNHPECQATFDIMGNDDFLQWNGGVFAFRRSERTHKFFTAWHSEWQKWGNRDQAALLRAMWANPLRVYTLGGEWNTVVSRGENGEVVTRYDDPAITAGILHFPTTARRTSGLIYGRLDSADAWSKVKK